MATLVFAIAPFTIFLGWAASLTAGHTKRKSMSMLSFTSSPSLITRAGITTNAIILCSYAIGNAVGQFMWKSQYQPR